MKVTIIPNQKKLEEKLKERICRQINTTRGKLKHGSNYNMLYFLSDMHGFLSGGHLGIIQTNKDMCVPVSTTHWPTPTP